jgi:hypothetical protein
MGRWGNDINTSGPISITHAITGDPMFVDIGGVYFHIDQGSAAIDQGKPTNVTRDFDKEPRFSLPDLGADEYWAPGALKYTYLPFTMRH